EVDAPAAVTTVSALESLGVLISDNCTPDSLLIVTSSDSHSGSCPVIVTRTYRVTDACNNYSEVTQTIYVADTIPPTFTPPTDITICRNINGEYNRDVTNTGDATGEEDNCDTSLDAAYTDSDVNMGTADAVGFITRTWTLTDNCGNVTSHDQIIWVQPVPRIAVTVPDTIFCNGSTVEFAIDSLVVSRGEVMYDLDVTYPAGLSGTLANGQNQIANISDLLTNSSDSYQTVTYRFRPYIQGKTGDPTCHDGVEVIITVHIEPTARVALTLADDELCNGENVNIQIATPTIAYNGLEFNVEAINSHPEITGCTDRTGLVVSDMITEALNNSGDTARLVTYVVVPATLDVSGNQKCYGIRDTVSVWVNPTPRATPVNYVPHICYGDTTDVLLLSPTVMSSGINEFNYSITSTASTDVVAGNRTALNSVVPGTHLKFPYTNESDTIQSVFFHIIPKVTGPGCPYGPPAISEIKVHPHPLQSLEILDSITCDGGQDGALQVICARGYDSLWVAWTGPDYWEEAAYNMFIAEECSQGYYTATVTDSLGCSSSDALNFLAPNTEVSLYFGQFISCPGAEDARMVVALTEGHAPPHYYNLVWNGTDTVSAGWMPPEGHFFTIDNLKPGDYMLSVVDANGCREELPRTLYDAPVTFASFEKSIYADYNISCKSYSDGTIRVSEIYSYYMDGTDTVFVSSRAPYSYQWSASDGGVITGSSTDSLLVNIPAGTYTLVVTDSQGCIFTFTETMTEPDGIDLIAEDVSLSNDGNYQISCHGASDGYINLQFDGGAGAYSYAWTGPDGFTANTASLTGIRAGTYNLTVTDGNMCHRYYTYILNEPDSLSIAVSTSHTPDNEFNINCNGGDGTIDITVTGGSGEGTYSYQWTKSGDESWSSTLEDLTVKAGTYQLQVTDVNGCVNTRSVEMTEPDALNLSLAVSDITCLNAPLYNDGSIDLTVSGGRPPYSYSWTGPEGFTSSLEDISGLTEGTYTITVTDAYGCSIASDTLLSLPEPISLESRVSDYNGFSVSCSGKSDGWLRIIPQTGTAPYSYSWSGPAGFTATTDSIYSLREGTYSVTVTDKHLCSVTHDITLVSPGPLSMTLDIGLSNGGSYNINCYGAATGRVNITAVNAVGTPEYIWSDGLTGAARDNFAAGYHEVIMTDANGCVADTSLTLTEPDSMRINFSLISPFCPESNDGSIFAGVTGGEGAYTFTWSDGQTTQEAVGLVQGLYTVEARDFNGCVVSDSMSLKALNDICVGIPNAFSPDGDGINEFWNITRISYYSEVEVIILNRWGEIVWKSEKGYPEPWDGRASDGKVLPMDSYHYAIDLHNGEKPIVGHVTIIR
ncbi:MAG TPA: T9SS type B sorting domain-containing protein, partial [Bacteroidales bacterium]|nr:T9SS type B sorting domain-containing protein [Bacteroidales bacterium]